MPANGCAKELLVGISEFKNRLANLERQGVQLGGNLILSAERESEVGVGVPAVGQHLDGQVSKEDRLSGLKLIALEDVEKGEEEDKLV